MGEVEALAVDKTGTLTKGELTVTDVVPLNGNSEDDVLRCARGLESRSEHPIGEAIVAEPTGENVPEREIEEFESITGKGVRADLGGRPTTRKTRLLREPRLRPVPRSFVPTAASPWPKPAAL